jgi:hypothetical protein
VDQVTMPKAAFDALMQQISALQATVDRLTALLEEKNQIILNLNRARFGQSSEKRTYVLRSYIVPGLLSEWCQEEHHLMAVSFNRNCFEIRRQT